MYTMLLKRYLRIFFKKIRSLCIRIIADINLDYIGSIPNNIYYINNLYLVNFSGYSEYWTAVTIPFSKYKYWDSE